MPGMMSVNFKRDGKLIYATMMQLDELPSLKEVITLPESRRKHEVVAIVKRIGLKRQFGSIIKHVEIDVQKPRKRNP